jgi:hypothetical protein
MNDDNKEIFNDSHLMLGQNLSTGADNAAGNIVMGTPFMNDTIPAKGSITDGYHTFDELYEHRHTLFIALCKRYIGIRPVWRSQVHSDGTSMDGWFILGIDKKKGSQITYHLPMSKWTLCDFVETLDQAPEWDGHTPADTLSRIANLV